MDNHWPDNELKFQLAALLVDAITDNCSINQNEQEKLRLELKRKFNPPFASLEVSEEELCATKTHSYNAEADKNN